MKNQGKKSKRNISGLTLISFLLTILTIFSCEKEENFIFKTYTLDVSNITSTEFGSPVTGTLIISHNAAVAFPLDLDVEYNEINVISNNTIVEAQSKSSCGNESLSVIGNINSKGIQTNDIGHIRKLILEMPYYVSQDSYKRVPGTFCFGFYIRDEGWFWNFTSIKPTLNNDLNMGFAEVAVDEKNVEIIGILFDKTTAINKIIFEAQKAK